jgi:putative spermidine/putrescine transport system ATP-binding protein
MAFLECKSISAAYGVRTVVHQLDLAIGEGELLSLLGPSGCGKTTLLRVIAGLTHPTRGSVMVAGEDVTSLPAYRRNFGVVFQNYALFPHLNVVENVAFGPTARRVPRREALTVATKMLELVRLSDLADRRVEALSGGQQQRVAVARALATRPRLLLLDEPFSALDRQLRVELQVELRKIIREVGVTTIFVTHDQSEAFALSDRIGVMRQGGLEQIDAPSILYNQPRTTFVLNFVGTASRFPGTVKGAANGGAYVETKYGSLLTEANYMVGVEVLIAIRPERISILEDGTPPAPNEIIATVRDRVYLGGQVLLSFATEEPDLLMVIASEQSTAGVETGRRMRLALASEDIIVLPAAA